MAFITALQVHREFKNLLYLKESFLRQRIDVQSSFSIWRRDKGDMVVLFHHHHHNLPLSLLSRSSPCARRAKVRPLISMSSDPEKKLLEFPHLNSTHRSLMKDLVSIVETGLGSQLLPSSLPADVNFFESQQGNSQGALHIRSGKQGSPIDLVSYSWLHCEVPSGVMDIVTMFSFLNDKSDAPHLLLEFIQSKPTSLILFMDLLPRKDLILHPDYLTHFYEDTGLDLQRQKLQSSSYIKPYLSSSLYIRSLLSPTAISVGINCEEEGSLTSGEVGDVVKQVLRVWVECACVRGREVADNERLDLVRRDSLIKYKAVEIDLTSNLPALFGPDVGGRVVEAVQKVFRVS